MSFAELCRTVERDIGQRARYEHSVRVARFAGLLAHRHRERSAKARLAGMLHDLARLYSSLRLLEECRRRAMLLDEFELRNPVVLHARLAAELARERYGVNDEAVLSAIRKHTVADARMSRLDCIVYLADGLEPARTHSDRATLAHLAFSDLKLAMRETLASSLRFLQARGQEPSPQTLAAARTFGAIAQTEDAAALAG